MQNILEKLGLNAKQASLYLALLDLGVASPVSTIAKFAKINRTTAYDILETLVQMGIIISNQKHRHLYYEALPPYQLVNYLKEQSNKFLRLSENATQILPEINARYKSSNRPKIYFYEGEEGLLRIYEERLKSSEEILAYVSDKSNQEMISWYFPKNYGKRAANKISIRALSPNTPQNRYRHQFDKKELRKSRLIPKEIFNFTPEINFFDNKIMIANWKEKMGIIIESNEIVEVFKQSFELAWDASEKYHKKIIKRLNKKKKT